MKVLSPQVALVVQEPHLPMQEYIRDADSILGWEVPGEAHGTPPVFCLEQSHGQRSLVGLLVPQAKVRRLKRPVCCNNKCGKFYVD